VIDLQEFTASFKLQNQNAKDEVIEAIFSESDGDISASLNLEEFKNSIQIATKKQEEAAESA